MAAIDAKAARDPDWVPPASSSSNSDLHTEKANNYSASVTPKIGESFLTEVQSVLAPPATTTIACQSKSETQEASTQLDPSFKDPAPAKLEDECRPTSTSHPQRSAYEFSQVDSAEQPRDLQSDLFLLDQAMQPQQPTASSVNMPVAELDASDALFGDALGRSLFAPPLFDDNKLLPFEGAVEPVYPASQGYSTNRLAGHPGLPSHSDGLQGLSKTADPSPHEPAEMETVLQGLGIINPQPQQADPHRPYYGQDVHLAGSVQFGRQKKRRLSGAPVDGPAFFPDTLDGPMAKRAKSEMTHGYYGSSPYGEMPRTHGRSYSVLNKYDFGRAGGHFRDMGGVDLSTRTHTDLYENLPPELQLRVDHLRAKISKMPRRKLRDSLAQEVTIEEVEPLMSVNRDDLAEMLGLGVTTWKIFIHKSFGLPRWPARVIKSRDMREKNLKMRLQDARNRGDNLASAEILQELKKLEEKRRSHRRNIFERAKAACKETIANFKKRSGNAAE